MSNSEEKPTREQKVFFWNVIAGVVASVVFLAFIQPLLTLVWNFLTSTSITLVDALVDLQYKNAALGERNWVAAFLSFLLLGGTVGFVSAISLDAVPRSKANDGEKKSILKKFSFHPLTRAAMALLLIICSLYLSIAIFTDLQLNTSFSQRLAVLAPHVTDQQLRILRADWASMTRKKDHQAISAKMEKLAADAKVILPAPLLAD